MSKVSSIIAINSTYSDSHLSIFISDWSSGLYIIDSAKQSSNGVCYYRVRDSDGRLLTRNYYKEELNFVLRE